MQSKNLGASTDPTPAQISTAHSTAEQAREQLIKPSNKDIDRENEVTMFVTEQLPMNVHSKTETKTAEPLAVAPAATLAAPTVDRIANADLES